jgi:hypothetical protein
MEDDPSVLPVEAGGNRAVGQQCNHHPPYTHCQWLLNQDDKPELKRLS